MHDAAPAADQEPAPHVAHDDPLRYDPPRHVAVPTKAAPPAATDQYAPETGFVSPAAKHTFFTPIVVPSKAAPEYVKEYDAADTSSCCVAVAAVHPEQPASAGVTTPALHTPKKPPRT